MNNITFIGMPGAGKSFIGKKLAERLGYLFLELDSVMEQKYKLPLQEILNSLGEDTFLTFQEKDAIEYTKNHTNLIISPGGSIVYSDSAMQHLKKISKIIYLKTSFETIQKRIGETPRGIVGIQEKTLKELYNQRTALYEKWADVEIDAECDASEIVEEIKNYFSIEVVITA